VVKLKIGQKVVDNTQEWLKRGRKWSKLVECWSSKMFENSLKLVEKQAKIVKTSCKMVKKVENGQTGSIGVKNGLNILDQDCWLKIRQKKVLESYQKLVES
jgi:hypothetical protein